MAKKPKNAEARQREKDESDPHAKALARYERAYQRERDNIDAAYEDLAFYAGSQWQQELLARRELEDRPALTFNRLPQFVHQVTGDIRQMRPGIKVVGVDDGADEDTAEILGGILRYIENRSDASHVYPSAADSQVTCGVGCWRVNIEYADDSTYNKEIAIELVEDPVSVLFDPDAVHPTRKDAMFAFEPADMTRAAFNEMFPDAAAASLDPLQIKAAPIGWFSEDVVRVAKYWYKEPKERRLCMTETTTVDVTDQPDKEAECLAKPGAKIVTKPGFAVKMRYMTGLAFVKPVDQETEVMDWPGRYIPLIPVFGEETRIGRKRVRWGLVRAMKDPQRLYNYMRSTQAEVVALQPTAPYLGTEINFRDYEAQWAVANNKALPYLTYKPDPMNGGQRPERVPPPVSSQGLAEEVASAENDLRNVTGIYNASLGAPSNETSGVAIQKRQQEGDTGTFLYIKNFSLGVGHGARVILDLIPHVYDTQRVIRIVGEDGKIDRVKINNPQGLQAEDGTDHELAEDIGSISKIENDVTVGAYDVHMEMGPSYTTKRQEMRDGMQAFMQTAPQAATLMLDIFAKAQDWPMQEQIAKRLHTMLPPQIQAMEAKEQNDPSLMPPPMPPNPAAEAEAMKAKADVEIKNLEVKGKELDNLKREFEVLKAQTELAAGGPPLDMNQLHTLLGQMDEALQFLGVHIAGQHAGPEAGPPPGMPGLPPEMPPPGMMPPDMGPPPGAPPVPPA